MDIIKGEKVKKVYRTSAEDVVALKGIDFRISTGEFVALMGPSGSGKTTLLDILGCLDNISDGRLEILGKSVSALKDKGLTKIRREKIGFIFQESFLIPTLTALENVRLPLVFAKRKDTENLAENFLNKVGLSYRKGHLPRQLSGGERQRVAIARALITQPQILLADEPTGNLDTKNGQDIFEIFQKLNHDGLTIVVATHDDFFGQKTKRILRLHDGEIQSDENPLLD